VRFLRNTVSDKPPVTCQYQKVIDPSLKSVCLKICLGQIYSKRIVSHILQAPFCWNNMRIILWDLQLSSRLQGCKFSFNEPLNRTGRSAYFACEHFNCCNFLRSLYFIFIFILSPAPNSLTTSWALNMLLRLNKIPSYRFYCIQISSVFPSKIKGMILTSAYRPDRLWGPPSLLFNGCWGGGHSPGVNRKRCQADNSPLTSDVNKTWIYTSTFPTPSWCSA
jgi:hypothetical protein